MTGARRLELYDDLGFLLARGSASIVRATNAALRSTGLRVRHFAVLSAAVTSGGIPQRELSELLGLDPSQIVALVDEMEARGLIARQTDERDRRTKLVAPTAAGREVHGQAKQAVTGARDTFLSGLDDRERATLVRLLRKALTAPEPGRATGSAHPALIDP